MPSIEFLLLGKPEIRIDGTPLPKLKSEKGTALLYYLATTGQEYKRDRLAALLWGDHNDSDARNNLRTLIATNLARPDVRSFLRVERDALQIEHRPTLFVDVAHFGALLRNPQATPEQLQIAFDLVRGEFLEGFVVRETDEFNQWVDAQRTWLRELILRTGVRLAVQHRQAGELDKAMSCVERLLVLDDLIEQAALQKIHLLALMGRPGEAVSYYDHFAEKYEEEFGDNPPEEVRKLIAKIKRGEIKALEETPSTATSAPAIASTVITAPPFQSPPQVQHFTGRERELEMISTILTRKGGGHRCALVGMGGAGKTALSTHCAHMLRHHFPDGVLWSQAAFGEPADILNGWARAFGYDFSTVSDVHHRAAALRGILATRRVLIVLDDVVDPLPMRLLLPGGDECAVLITTRNEEIARALTAEVIPVNELSRDDGLRLLEKIIGTQRSQGETQAAQTLCRLLSNLPLAIEIAAQLLLVRDRMTIGQMLDRLRQAKQRIGLSIADLEVRASFDVSWRTLGTQQQEIFGVLAIFEGRSFTAAALAAILELDLYTVEDRLAELKVRSLVREEGQDRYHQHPLLADFAREKLVDPDSYYQRLAVWYESFARQQAQTHEVLEPEWENLMAGMAVAQRLQMPALVLAYADALEQPWFMQARYIQARQGFQWAVEAAQTLGEDNQCSRHLLNWGKACLEQDDFDEATRVLSLACELAMQQEEDEGVIQARHWLAHIAVERGEYRRAYQLLEENRQLCMLANNPLGLARTYYLLALCSHDQNNLAEGKRLCQEALTLLEQNQSNQERTVILRLLADIHVEMREFTEALTHAETALQISQLQKNYSEVAASFYSMAFIHRFQENFQQAEQYARQSLEFFERIGDRGFRGVVLYELSQILTRLSRIDEAMRVGMEGNSLLHAAGDHYTLVRQLNHLGDLSLLLGDQPQAINYWTNAHQLAQTVNHPLSESLRQKLV